MFSPSISYVRSRAFLSNKGLVWTADWDELVGIRNLPSHYLVIGHNNFRILLKDKESRWNIYGQREFAFATSKRTSSQPLASELLSGTCRALDLPRQTRSETEAAPSFFISVKCQVKFWSSTVAHAEKDSAVLSWMKFPLREFGLRVNSRGPRGHPAALGAPTL